jgi:hypothetical protein
MKNPKCPYCGETMALHLCHGYFSYFCPSCYSEAPIRTTTEEAYAAAMKRNRAKGEWNEYYLYQYAVGYKCSCCDYFQLHRTRFCPNCGADMREEEDDEHIS